MGWIWAHSFGNGMLVYSRVLLICCYDFIVNTMNLFWVFIHLFIGKYWCCYVFLSTAEEVRCCIWSCHVPPKSKCLRNVICWYGFCSVLCNFSLSHVLQNSRLGTRYEIALSWMPQILTNEKSTLVQIMACCHQAPSRYLIQCWPRSMSLYGITMATMS